MNELQVINSRQILGHDVRVYGDFENPLFLAKDMAEWIEHSNHRAMLDSVDSDEKTKRAYPVNNPYGGYQVEEQWFLTEAGLYEVLMLSRKPVAKEFKKQVKALLHDLRTGKKDIVDINAMLTDPDNILKIAQNWKADRDRLRATETKLITAAQILLEDQAPKVLFADAVADSEGTVLIGTLAKILNDNGFPTGAIRFFEILRRDGYLGKSGDNYNMPT